MTPTTKAGRVLAGRLAVLESQSVRREATPAVIVAIEQEAAAAERARLRAAVWAMDALQYDDASEPLLRKTTVLALLRASAPGDEG